MMNWMKTLKPGDRVKMVEIKNANSDWRATYITVTGITADTITTDEHYGREFKTVNGRETGKNAYYMIVAAKPEEVERYDDNILRGKLVNAIENNVRRAGLSTAQLAAAAAAMGLTVEN